MTQIGGIVMTELDYFLWVIIPYLSLTIFVVGHVHRYNTDQFGWSAQSSEFIQKDQLLKWGVRCFTMVSFLFSSDMWQEC